MAIKLDIKCNEPSGGNLDYPVIMQSLNGGDIVLFFSEKSGAVVGGVDHNNGHYHDDWINASNSKVWKVFTGKIILENKY